jgi:hypothetical protein
MEHRKSTMSPSRARITFTEFHGNLYGLWNGSLLNAADYFTNATPGNHKPRSTVNHFGGSHTGRDTWMHAWRRRVWLCEPAEHLALQRRPRTGACSIHTRRRWVQLFQGKGSLRIQDWPETVLVEIERNVRSCLDLGAGRVEYE